MAPPTRRPPGRSSPQSGDHADQQREQYDEDLRPCQPRTVSENDTRTLTRVQCDDLLNQKRQNRMSDARIAFAPIAARFVHDRVDVATWPRVRALATHAGSASGAMVGDSSPGVTAAASSSTVARAVLVEHQVLLPEHHTLYPCRQLVTGRGVPGFGALDQHGFGVTQRIAERHQIVQRERPSGSDDIGDDVGHAQLDGNLDSAVEANNGCLDSLWRRGLFVPGSERMWRSACPLGLRRSTPGRSGPHFGTSNCRSRAPIAPAPVHRNRQPGRDR